MPSDSNRNGESEYDIDQFGAEKRSSEAINYGKGPFIRKSNSGLKEWNMHNQMSSIDPRHLMVNQSFG